MTRARTHRCPGIDCDLCERMAEDIAATRMEEPSEGEMQAWENAYEAGLDRLGGSR